MANPDNILTFWFGSPDHPDYGKPRPAWFAKDPEFDQTLRRQFLDTYHQAAAGHLQTWQASPTSALALILLLDQLPRNIFRQTPQAFATDPQALAVAEQMVGTGWDQALVPVQRWFVYLPFEHSESLADQRRAVQLFETLAWDPDSQSAVTYAHKHLAVIERFGRFPHRNAILGRFSTPEELAFLQEPGSSF
ncbi:MAG: DUF924 family protein [Cyanobacteriota bacterium]|nr:DUF924 family protein [Cyanobacteriota bacterium]